MAIMAAGVPVLPHYHSYSFDQLPSCDGYLNTQLLCPTLVSPQRTTLDGAKQTAEALNDGPNVWETTC